MKWILIILCAILSVACTRTQKWSVTLHKSVINITNKRLHYEIKTDEGLKNEFIGAFDSINIMFYKERDVERDVLTSTVRQNGIKTEQETIFNLTDTSKYEYNLAYEIIPKVGNTSEEKIFARHLSWELGEHSTDENAIIVIKLNVTDSIVNIMQKDHNILDKFKEYYDR
jgi:hypothetical protein